MSQSKNKSQSKSKSKSNGNSKSKSKVKTTTNTTANTTTKEYQVQRREDVCCINCFYHISAQFQSIGKASKNGPLCYNPNADFVCSHHTKWNWEKGAWMPQSQEEFTIEEERRVEREQREREQREEKARIFTERLEKWKQKKAEAEEQVEGE